MSDSTTTGSGEEEEEEEEEEETVVTVEEEEATEGGGSSGLAGQGQPPPLFSPPASPPLVEPPSILYASQDTTRDTSSTISVDSPKTTISPCAQRDTPTVTPTLPTSATTWPLPRAAQDGQGPQIPASVSLPPYTLTPSLPAHLPSISQLSTSIVTPSTISSLSLTPSSLDPSPLPLSPSQGYTAEVSYSTGLGSPVLLTSSGVGLQMSERDGPERLMPIGEEKSGFSGHGSQDSIACPDPPESGHRNTARFSCPNLSLSTEEHEVTLPATGQQYSQESSLSGDTSTEGLDPTPVHVSPVLQQLESAPTSASATVALRTLSPVAPLPQPSPPPSLSSLPPPPSSSSLSLQEAFLKSKADFVKQSQQRLEKVKADASEKRVQAAIQRDTGHLRDKPKAMAGRSKVVRDHYHPALTASRSAGKENAPRMVTFSSPVLQSQAGGMFSPPDIHKGNAAY